MQEPSVSLSGQPVARAPGLPGAVRVALAGAALIALWMAGREVGALIPVFVAWVEGLGVWGPLVFMAGYAVATVGSSSELNVGWVAGAGMEISLGEKMSAKAEYLHFDTDSDGTIGIPFSPEATGDVVRLGLNYRF